MREKRLVISRRSLWEASRHDWLSRLFGYADANKAISEQLSGEWHFFHTDEACSVLAQSRDVRTLILVAGRQIMTKEILEVLALATRANFHDGATVGHFHWRHDFDHWISL